MKKRIKIQGALMCLALAAGIVFAPFLMPSGKQTLKDLVLDAAGFIIILAGFLLRILARGYKSETSLEGSSLVKGGIYRLSRNPMYLGTLVIGLGLTLVLFAWWVFIVFATIFLIIYIPQIHKEEGYLQRNFGREYEEYCKGTPIFLPKPSALLKFTREKPLFYKWDWVKKELGSLVAVFFVVLLIKAWQDIPAFGAYRFAKEFLVLIASVICFSLIISYYVKKTLPKER